MGRRSGKNRPAVTKRTLIVRSPLQMWEKLAWNVSQLDTIQRGGNDEDQPLCYALFDACIAAQSLQDWVRQAVPQDAKAFEQSVFERIPSQEMCVSVANSVKHGHYTGDWQGELEIAFQPSDEDFQGGWFVRHFDPEGKEWNVTISSLRDLSRQWFDFLVENKLVDGPYVSPAWHSNKMRRMFGTYELPEPDPL